MPSPDKGTDGRGGVPIAAAVPMAAASLQVELPAARQPAERSRIRLPP